jgi:hypothetical protein
MINVSQCASEMFDFGSIKCQKVVIKFAKIIKKKIFESLKNLVNIVSHLQVLCDLGMI